MTDLQHRNDPTSLQEDPATIAKNGRIARMLFLIYLVLYAAFVLLNTFWPKAMELVPVAGINLAILLGSGLIVAAIVMSFLYGWLCRPTSKQDSAIANNAKQVNP